MAWTYCPFAFVLSCLVFTSLGHREELPRESQQIYWRFVETLLNDEINLKPRTNNPLRVLARFFSTFKHPVVGWHSSARSPIITPRRSRTQHTRWHPAVLMSQPAAPARERGEVKSHIRPKRIKRNKYAHLSKAAKISEQREAFYREKYGSEGDSKSSEPEVQTAESRARKGFTHRVDPMSDNRAVDWKEFSAARVSLGRTANELLQDWLALQSIEEYERDQELELGEELEEEEEEDEEQHDEELDTTSDGKYSIAEDSGQERPFYGQDRSFTPHHEYQRKANYNAADPCTFGFIELGTVFGAHGVKGELKVKSDSHFGKDRLSSKGQVWMNVKSQRYPRQVSIKKTRKVAGFGKYLMTLKGVRDADSANKLFGAKLYIREEMRPTLEENEVWASDIEEMDVYLAKRDEETDEWKPGQRVGSVLGIIPRHEITGSPDKGDDMLEIQLDGKDEGEQDEVSTLLPYIPEFVLDIDHDRQIVLINPPRGLLDACIQPAQEEEITVKGYLRVVSADEIDERPGSS